MDNGGQEKAGGRRRKRGFSRAMGGKIAEIAKARQRMNQVGMRQAAELPKKLFCVNCPRVLGGSTMRYFASTDGRSDSYEHEALGLKEGAVRIHDLLYVCGECAKIPGLVDKLKNPEPGHSEENEIIST